MYGKRNAIRYIILIIFVIISGLSARRLSVFLPIWINLYLGDILWGLMIFLLFGLLFRARSTRVVAAGALIFSYAVEFSQLYHSQWIDSLRHTSVGGLVLGYGFLWSDLISYTLGIGFGLLIERRMN